MLHFPKKIILFYCLIFLMQIMNGQTFVHEFGKYSGEEFNMKQYDKDPSAEAVVLYDIGKSFFAQTDNGFELIFERTTKIKIFTKAGLKWAKMEIPLYQGERDLETVYDLEGNTYNYENNKIRITPLNSKNTYMEKLNDHWKLKKFAMPDIKEGSIIEIQYKVRSPYLFNLRNWEFQYKIPVIYSEYTTKMIPFYEYVYILQGANKFDSMNSYIESDHQQIGAISYQNMVYEFTMKDVPAFKDEGFLASTDDYMVKLNFQLSVLHRINGSNQKIMTTWPKLIEDLLKEETFGKYMKSSQKSAKTIIDTLSLKPRTAKEKTEILEKYVKANFNWNGRQYKMASKSVKDLLKTKTGNCADINLYLTGILNAAGIEAYPVILSTRDNGKIPIDYPFEHFFNYVISIVKIDNQYIFLDATEPLCPFNQLPTRCINDRGLIINKEQTAWAYIKTPSTSFINDSIDLKLNKTNDSIAGSFHVTTTGYEALQLRGNYLANHNNIKKALLNSSLILSDSLVVSNLSQIDQPFEIRFNANMPVEMVEDKLLIDPFCGNAISENPFKQSGRSYPIDMIYKKGRHFKTNIEIPEGYKILSKPEDVNINDNQIKILYHVKQISANLVQITGQYEFKKEVYEPSEYMFLKEYYTRIVEKFNEKLILAKL
jgi:transglutaminase-like putative cysteine protease